MEIAFSNFTSEIDLSYYLPKKDFILVTIPCYAEEDLLITLMSLDECEDCGLIPVVILLINSPSEISGQYLALNKKVYREVQTTVFCKIKVIPIHINDIPIKLAGVGMARRIAMDLANQIYSKYKKDHFPILCLDADSKVEINYFIELVDYFNKNPELAAVSIHFEHPYNEVNDTELRNGIIDYELHLRYFIEAQRWAGHPHAFHTIGSSMAVRSDQYRLQGGMNKRKAGEDFYFLHKFSRIGKLADLNTTTVYPGVRVSDRVPFGTGKALQDIKNGLNFKTYSVDTFEDLKKIIDSLNKFQMDDIQSIDQLFPETFLSCFGIEKIRAELKESYKNSSSHENFKKRFYYWFDAFKVFKYAHYCRDHHYPNQTVFEAINLFFKQTMGCSGFSTKENALKYLRQASKLHTFP